MERKDLKRFCLTWEFSMYDLGEPFDRGDFSYGTNGHVAVRVPKINGQSPLADVGKKTPEIEKIFADALEPQEYIPVPDPGTINVVVCEECWEGPDCDCEETGFREVFSWRKVGEQYFQNKYLRLIRTLPGAEIGTTKGMKAARFRFDGGDGLVMPVDISRCNKEGI
jgi:hypothetical protein